VRLLCLQPVEGVEDDMVAATADFAAARLPVTVRILPAMPAPAGARDAARGQEAGAAYLRAGLDRRPAEADRVLVLAGVDLFIPMLTFIFGQAQLDGRAAVVSLARLRPEFYGLPPAPAVLAARLRKETLHELGHTFGLVHCPDPRCAMALSVNIAGIDRKRDDLCRDCAVRLADKLEAAPA